MKNKNMPLTPPPQRLIIFKKKKKYGKLEEINLN